MVKMLLNCTICKKSVGVEEIVFGHEEKYGDFIKLTAGCGHSKTIYVNLIETAIAEYQVTKKAQVARG